MKKALTAIVLSVVIVGCGSSEPKPVKVPKFKVGDIVQLRTGGPHMLVSTTWCFIECEWIDVFGRPRAATYREELLQPVAR